MRHRTTNRDLEAMRTCAENGMTLAATARTTRLSVDVCRYWARKLDFAYYRWWRRLPPPDTAAAQLRATVMALKPPPS